LNFNGGWEKRTGNIWNWGKIENFGLNFRGIVVFELKTGVVKLGWAVWARWARKKCAKMRKK
jgi:hypothetical protein